jgi:AraC family transcriptional regulator
MHPVLDEFINENCAPQGDLPREVREFLLHLHRSLFDCDLNIRSLKSSCRIRDNNFSTRFRYVMGMTIKQYVEALRMKAASRLLREEKIGIFDVAVSVGYHNLQTFYRAFERFYGCTPAKYRNSPLSSTYRFGRPDRSN